MNPSDTTPRGPGPGVLIGGSLLQDLGDPGAPAPPVVRPPLKDRAVAWVNASPARKQRLIIGARIASIALAVGLGVGSYFYFRPVPQPDYATDGIGEVFNYTLLTDEFNRLPVEERLKLIQQLVSRLKGMSAGDSAMMAAFAAGIAGSAREQLKENISRLMIDSWDKFAVDYGSVADADRDAFLDKTMVDFMKMAEATGGRVRDISDEKRLEEIQSQVKRDREWLNKPENKPGQREFGEMWVFLEGTVGQHSSPIQRARGTQLMRDMGRRLRNEDIGSGKPKGGG